MGSTRLKICPSADQIYESVAKSLSLGVLCSLAPGGEPFKTYTQSYGKIRFNTGEYASIDPVKFISTSSHLATHMLPLLSKFIQFEMGYTHGNWEEGCLGVLSQYPFLFSSFSLITSDEDPEPTWDIISDISFTNFLLVGGITGIGNDISGYAIIQESQPGELLEAAAFQTPSSVIAPGFTEEHLKAVRAQEVKSLTKLIKSPGSILAMVLSELEQYKVPVGVRVLYGVSSKPFNNIDKVIDKIPR